MKNEEKVKQGKRNLSNGRIFERLVRQDLEEKGFICSKWQNNLEWEDSSGERKGKLIAARQGRFRLTSTGFPDFIAIQHLGANRYDVIGVEVKSRKYLSKEEKEKCRFLLDKKIFSNILIAYKDLKKRGNILYLNFEDMKK